EQWRKRDPIGLLEQKLVDAGVSEDELQEIKDGARERIREAVKFADESEEPPLEELYTDVYAGEDEYMGEK
ncbi:MAG: thiamine pyrophosphate-dependent enzyme, partial [Actinomycetota bacterium]